MQAFQVLLCQRLCFLLAREHVSHALPASRYPALPALMCLPAMPPVSSADVSPTSEQAFLYSVTSLGGSRCQSHYVLYLTAKSRRLPVNCLPALESNLAFPLQPSHEYITAKHVESIEMNSIHGIPCRSYTVLNLSIASFAYNCCNTISI